MTVVTGHALSVSMATNLFHLLMRRCARHPKFQDGRKVIAEKRVYIITVHDGAHTLASQDLETMLCVWCVCSVCGVCVVCVVCV